MDDLELSERDLDLEIDAMFQPPEPAPKQPLSFEPPVLVEHLSADAYHADVASIGIHGLALVGKSPLHHWHEVRRPDREIKEKTTAQTVGDAIHLAVLEPERFASECAVAPDVDRRTRAGKEDWAAFQAANVGKLTVRAEDHACALRVAGSVREHPLGRMFLCGPGKREASIFWTDKETGVRCRMRPDFIPDSGAVLVDLKSCEDAGEAAFTRNAWNYGYHLTAAWYLEGWKALTGEKREYVFAAWEKDQPHACAWYYADDDLIAAGRDRFRALLRIYADCLAKDKWPGYAERLCPLYAPAWAMDRS